MFNARPIRFAAVLLPAAALVGCAQTPFGPTVQVMPGPHKSFEAFASDGQYCKSYSQSQVAGQAQAVNNQAVGGALLATALGAGLGAALGGGNGAAIGAASGAGLGTGVSADASANAQAGIQAQYDNAYAQCMYTKGNQVAGWEPPPGLVQDYGAPRVAQERSPLVRSVQGELIRLGYLSGGADGVAGGRTVAAIRSFEQHDGLPVDGAASNHLLAALQSTPSMASAAPSSAQASSSGWVQPTASASSSAPAASPSSAWVSPVSTKTQ